MHGSGKLGRGSWGYASRADFLARLGYAVLLYDKRGSGASSPSEKEPDLQDLEEDLLAGLAFLTHRDDIDSRRLQDLAWWQANHDFQPRLFLPHIKVPVLALYGGGDWMTPPSANAPLLEELIRSGGNEDVTVVVFPRADHRVELPMGPDEEGRWRWPRIAPAMLETVAAWLQDRDREAGVQARTRSACGSGSSSRL